LFGGAGAVLEAPALVAGFDDVAVMGSIGRQKGPLICVQEGPLSWRIRNDRAESGSISAEAARRNDCLKFSEIEVADRAQRLGGGAVL
jgi:hypothetical protein